MAALTEVPVPPSHMYWRSYYGIVPYQSFLRSLTLAVQLLERAGTKILHKPNIQCMWLYICVIWQTSLNYHNLQMISKVASVCGDIKLLVLTSYLWNARDWPGKRSCQSQPMRLIAGLYGVWQLNKKCNAANVHFCCESITSMEEFVCLRCDHSLSSPSWNSRITAGCVT
mgnify:CR=1 FL=1